MVRMRSMGISLDADEIEKMRVLMRVDRRSLSWLIREAVRLYLQSRAEDVAKYSAQFAGQPAAGAGHAGAAERGGTSDHQQAELGVLHGEANKGITGEKD